MPGYKDAYDVMQKRAQKLERALLHLARQLTDDEAKALAIAQAAIEEADHED